MKSTLNLLVPASGKLGSGKLMTAWCTVIGSVGHGATLSASGDSKFDHADSTEVSGG